MKYALIGWLWAIPIHMEFDTLAQCQAMRQHDLHCYAVRPGEQYTLLPRRQQWR